MAIDNNIVGHAEIAYLGDPFEQYAGINGKPLVGGHIEVYLAGTDTKYITFENFDGAQNPFKVPINNDGRVVMLADPSLTYDIYIYDSFNNLASSRVNVQCNVPGTINLSGADTRIKNTDGTLDITLETSADNVRVYNIDTHHKELGVEEPLYFVQDDASATIIGIQESGYVNPSALSAYMPYSAIGYDENGRISGYDGSALAGNYEAGSYVDIDNYVISVTGLQPSGDYASASDISAINEKINELSADASGYAVEAKFEFDNNDQITAYNGSAFAGQGGAAFTGITTDNSLTGDGLNDPVGLASSLKFEASNKETQISAGNITVQASGVVPSLKAVRYDANGDYENSLEITPSSMIFQYAPGGVEIVNTAAIDSWNDAKNTLRTNSATWNNKQDALSFGYTENDAISSINGSVLYASADIESINLSAGNGIDITTTQDAVTISVTGDYVEHDELSSYATTALVSSVSSTLHDEITSTSGINVVYHDDHFLGDGTSGDPLRLDSPIVFSSNISIGSYGPNGSTVTDIDSHDHTYIGSDGITLSQDGQTATINASGYNNKVDTSALSGYLVESSFDYDSNNKISGYNGSAFATDDITGINLSAGTGIDITVDDDTVTISVTAQGGNPEVDNLVTAQSATWNSVTGKADTTALTAYQPVSSMNNYATTALVSSVSSELYSAFSSISGEYELIAGSGIELTDDSVLKTTTITVTAKGGDAEVESLVHSQSATWNTVTGKQDAGNYYSASNPSGFITAGGELTLVAGSGINITETGTSAIIECTAQGSEIPTAVSSYWQDASDAVNTNSATWNTVTGKQDAGDYYSASNPSGFITAAGELTLSGVGGITVSETGTTALIELANTDLFVQAPLFSGMSGTSAYIGCNFNETVLWSGSQAWSANSTATLSEPLSSFDKVQFVIQPFPTKACEILNYEVSSLEYDISVIGFNGTSGLRFSRVRLNSTDNYTKLAYSDSIELTFGNTAFSWNASNAKTMKIIGVNRKA